MMRVRMAVVALAIAAAGSAACSEIGTGVQEAAAIELPPFPSPSVVVNDTLRDANGRVAPIKALVLNVKGDVIADAPVRYAYADFARDSAILVDSATGIVRAVAPAKGLSGDGRIAARVGGSLQVLRSLIVTTRPDSLVAQATGTLLTTVFPDTGRLNAGRNTVQVNATVKHIEANNAPSTGVNAWVVRFRLVTPANPNNDSTASVFLVDESLRPSVIDTSNTSGIATRGVRVRAASFPATPGALDSVRVEATASYRGVPLAGSPVTIAVPIKRPL